MSSTELTERQRAEIEAAEKVKAGISPEDLVLPLLKLGQGLSDEVKAGNAEVGDWYNSLTKEVIETPFEFVIADYFKGRFYAPKGGPTYVAAGPVAPSNWPEQYRGRNFADIPDAQEQFSAAANRGEFPWGEGPPISTTFNYVGFLPADLKADALVPVRISLQKMAVPVAKAVNTLISLSGAPWERVFLIGSEEGSKDNYTFALPTVARGRRTSPEEAEVAYELNQKIQQASVRLTGDAPDEPKDRPEEGSGLPVN